MFLLCLLSSKAERKLHEDFENRTRSDTQRRIEELRRKERDLFEKEAADFRASLQKDIDYVESMAAEFELKAEKALAERRKQLAEERRNAVQKLCVVMSVYMYYPPFFLPLCCVWVGGCDEQS